jgi:DNA-binding NarL/FixJ family response regulator
VEAFAAIMPGPSVLLAGHARAQAHALRTLLETDGMSVCDEVADLQSTVDRAARARPDICLLDATVAGARYEHVAAIRKAARGVRVVIFGGRPSDTELLDAVAAGAAGHLRRDLHAAGLIAALRDVLAGRPAFPRRLEALLADALYGRT